MLTLKKISKVYGDNWVFKNVSMTLGDREIASVIGPSGVGKTTLLRVIAGLTGYEEGDLIVEGDVHSRGQALSYVFQESRLLPWLTAEENIRLVNESLTSEELDRLLSLSRLSHAKDLLPEEMSGGMRQRVSLARAFAYHPNIILMDEPFKSIDEYLKSQLMADVLALWRAQPKAILMVTHDLEEALSMSDTLYFMGDHPARLIKVMDVAEPRNMTSTQKEEAKEIIRQFWKEKK